MSDHILEKYGTDYYIIVKYDEANREDLVREVNHLLLNGYTPIGGISVRAGSISGAYLMQAMVKTKTLK